jgi:hypothetical protein
MATMSQQRRSPEQSAHDVLAAEAFAVGAPDPALHERHEQAEAHTPHDVLAAEEFAVGAADPALHGRAEAHDVLASEAFAMGAADPALHHGPLVLPEDPYGDQEPHDILAAEEFALPAAPPGSRVPLSAAPAPLQPVLSLGVALALIALLRRRWRRRS